MSKDKTPNKDDKRDYQDNRPAIDPKGKSFDELLKDLSTVDPGKLNDSESDSTNTN